MLSNRPFIYRLFLYLLFLIILTYVQYFTDRHESFQLLFAYAVVFSIYLFLVASKIPSWQEIVVVAVIVRLSLFFDLPNLSDDFFRFIWDGRLLAVGINPFAQVPEFYMSDHTKIDGLTWELYEQLNSKRYFTIYPPISQFIFWLSVKLNVANTISGSVFIMRMIIFFFEIGSIYLIHKTLALGKRNTHLLSVYALNPLVILELTGNLHFEGIMIFFFLLAIYLFHRNKVYRSAIAIAASIATKLMPLMILPIFIKKHSRFFTYFLIIGISLIVFFLPMLNQEFFNGMSDSLSLFFKSFEFNGGLFFLLREIGFLIKGYDIVSTLGPAMSLTAFTLILVFSFFIAKKSDALENTFIIVFFIQLLFATTVHPWYIIPMIALSCGTSFKFPLVWSFFIFFTYIGYSTSGYQHPFLIITLEYVVVIPLAIFEIYKHLTTKTEKSN